MTKKDYDLIAACIGHNIHTDKDNRYDIDGKGLTASLLNELKLDNPRFNESIFWDRVEYWRKQHGGS